MTSIVHLFLLFTLASVSLAADTAHLRQEEDIREAVFRYQFDHNASAQQKNANAYCLSVGEKDGDPSDRFMKRFAGHRPPVRKASACIASDRVVDKRTAKPGLLFRVSIITWISDTEAKVAGGYYEGNLSSSGNTYTVKKENGKWEVTNDEMHWISEGLNAAVVDYC